MAPHLTEGLISIHLQQGGQAQFITVYLSGFQIMSIRPQDGRQLLQGADLMQQACWIYA